MNDIDTKITFEMTPSLLEEYRKELESDPCAQLAMNACWKTDPISLCLSRNKVYETQHVFSHKVETEGKPISNQKSSGRCWIFACLNVIRIPFMKTFNLDDFEFSQTHLFFWDKIERCNYFLSNVVECLKLGEEVDGRLLSYLLNDPTNDGGQWDMLVNLINRYGLMPKKCFPESYCAENSLRLNRILQTKLREYTRDLKEMIGSHKDFDISSSLKVKMKEIYRIVAICLGIPPHVFTWEYYDKQKVYKTIGPVTPVEFYQKHVKHLYDVDQKACLVNDPRPTSPYGRAFTVHCLGNMVNGRKVIYNNQPVELMMKLAAESVKNGEAVWFGCEVGKRYASKLGIHDLEVHDYKSVFGLDINMGMTKSERLIFGDSLMTHAMVLTAVTIDENGHPIKWRVENSWGDERGEKGYNIMTSEWFKEFVFEVVVDKKYVPEEVMDVYNQDPIILPAWDPMGALAREYMSVCEPLGLLTRNPIDSMATSL